MLEIKFIRENLTHVQKAVEQRGDSIDWAALIAADDNRKKVLQEIEALRHRRNVVSDQIAELNEELQQRLTVYMRHVVAIAGAYEIRTPAGVQPQTPFYLSATVIKINDVWFLLSAGHAIQDIETLIRSPDAELVRTQLLGDLIPDDVRQAISQCARSGELYISVAVVLGYLGDLGRPCHSIFILDAFGDGHQATPQPPVHLRHILGELFL